MKTMDFSVLSGSASADPPNWLLLLIWAAVAVVLLVCAILVALVLARWLCLWKRQSSLSGGERIGFASPALWTPLDEADFPHFRLHTWREMLLPSDLHKQEETGLLDPPVGGMLP